MKTISRKNLPIRLPFAQTALAVLLLDYYNAPQWLCGVIGCIIVILWIVAIYTKSQEKYFNMFRNEDYYSVPERAEMQSRMDNALNETDGKKTKSKFQEKLEEMRRQQP